MNDYLSDSRQVKAVLARIEAELSEVGIEDAATDAELLVAHVIGDSRGRVQALAVMGAELDAEQCDRVLALTGERAQRIPLQHLTGRAPFRGIELSVGPGVFVPRPETETVVQFAIDALRMVPSSEPIAVDLCTGSGAIALSIAHEVPTAKVYAVEKSIEAHAWAERNVGEWGDGRVTLMLGDVADLDPSRGSPGAPISRAFGDLQGRVHVLISNPPYVPKNMVPRDPEVRDHDPKLALYSGADGLDLIRVISRVARQALVPGGMLVLEHAELQGAAIQALLRSDGWLATATHTDLTGRDRATTAICPDLEAAE